MAGCEKVLLLLAVCLLFSGSPGSAARHLATRPGRGGDWSDGDSAVRGRPARRADSDHQPPRVELLAGHPFQQNTLVVAENSDIPVLLATLRPDNALNALNDSVVCSVSHEAFALRREGDALQLLLMQPLDRETRDRLTVTISCMHTAPPPRTTLTTLTLIVSDVNDNAPVFTRDGYVVSVAEKAAPGTEVVRVAAYDADSGLNGVVRYSLQPREDTLFSLQPHTGLLTTRRPLDRDVFRQINLRVIAVDSGQPPLTATALVVIVIADVNDNNSP